MTYAAAPCALLMALAATSCVVVKKKAPTDLELADDDTQRSQTGSPTEEGSAVDARDAGECSGLCATALVAGDAFACALYTDRNVRCWGENDRGQTGSSADGPTLRAHLVPGLSNVRELAVGMRHACALQADGRVLCWGNDESGIVTGKPNALAHPVPQEIESLAQKAAHLVAMSNHVCALKVDGELWCWGTNDYGQCGVAGADGGAPPKIVPTPTLSMTQVRRVGGAEDVTCGLVDGGAVQCIGRNFSGQLGRGSADTVPHPTPADVKTLRGDALVLRASTGFHNAVLSEDGRVWAWGSNARGGVLGPSSPAQVLEPRAIEGVEGIAEVAPGGYFTCVRSAADGTVSCWGDNTKGQVGVLPDGGTNQPTPRKVGVTGATQIAAGRDWFVCAIAGGQVVCWGDNSKGQLGRGEASDPDPVAAPVALEP